MHTATVISLDLVRKTPGRATPAAGESSARHERRSSLAIPDAGSPDRIADLLLAMETHPLAEVAVWVVRSADRRGRVAVRVGAGVAAALLDPRDARFTADVVFDEQAFAGAAGVADQLHRAADEAEALNGVRRRPRHGRFHSSHATLILLAALAGALFALSVLDALGGWASPAQAAGDRVAGVSGLE